MSIENSLNKKNSGEIIESDRKNEEKSSLNENDPAARFWAAVDEAVAHKQSVLLHIPATYSPTKHKEEIMGYLGGAAEILSRTGLKLLISSDSDKFNRNLEEMRLDEVIILLKKEDPLPIGTKSIRLIEAI